MTRRLSPEEYRTALESLRLSRTAAGQDGAVYERPAATCTASVKPTRPGHIAGGLGTFHFALGDWDLVDPSQGGELHVCRDDRFATSQRVTVKTVEPIGHGMRVQVFGINAEHGARPLFWREEPQR